MSIQDKPPFIGSYSYGPEAEQMSQGNRLKAFFNRIAVFLLKPLLFPSAGCLKNCFLDKDKIEKSKEQLQTIGGESVKIQTPDGDLLDGMYLSAEKFRDKLDKYFDLKPIFSDGEISKLQLKEEFILKDKLCSFDYPVKEEVINFIEELRSLGVECSFVSEGWGNPMPLQIQLPKISSDPKEAYTREDAKLPESGPTALIAGGSGTSYSMYKGYAVQYLLRGINVMLLDFRGSGQSRGVPSEHKLKLDLETAYQYLSREKQVENQDLLVHGHCQGASLACDLAARREGVNLLLDRGFVKYNDIAQRILPKIRKVIKRILPSIIKLDNTANLSKIKGNIAVEVDTRDELIKNAEEVERMKKAKSQEDAELGEEHLKILRHLPVSQKGQIIKLMDSDIGHGGNWMSKLNTAPQFNRFLEQANLFRRSLF